LKVEAFPLWDFLATSYYSHLPARVEAQNLLSQITPYDNTFGLIEVLFGALIPACILLIPGLRRQNVWIIAALATLGIIAKRWNVTLSSLIPLLGWTLGDATLFGANRYFPSLIEWGVGLRFLPLFPDEASSTLNHLRRLRIEVSSGERWIAARELLPEAKQRNTRYPNLVSTPA
jgi:hypothetical protein